MKAIFDCEVEYTSSGHLMQIYSGFFELAKKGIINLSIKRLKYSSSADPIINVVVDKKHRVIYDTIDGLNWIRGGVEENLTHFQKKYIADFYFKRSYNERMQEYAPANCKVFPLGLNYNIQPDKNLLFLTDSVNDKIKYIFKTNKLLKKFSGKTFYHASDFEYYPIKPKENKILFFTRLWNPDESKSESSREHRKQINIMRVQCIEACRKKYGKMFTGGLIMDAYASKHHKELAIPDHFTKKGNYIASVKDHTICIATTGLHDSIGWKLAEYVAASRVVVTEPLKFSLPGNFNKGENYFEFETPEQLISQIDFLQSNPGQVLQTMKNNYYYYNNFVKPERLILNTLLTVVNEGRNNG